MGICSVNSESECVLILDFQDMGDYRVYRIYM